MPRANTCSCAESFECSQLLGGRLHGSESRQMKKTNLFLMVNIANRSTNFTRWAVIKNPWIVVLNGKKKLPRKIWGVYVSHYKHPDFRQLVFAGMSLVDCLPLLRCFQWSCVDYIPTGNVSNFSAWKWFLLAPFAPWFKGQCETRGRVFDVFFPGNRIPSFAWLPFLVK